MSLILKRIPTAVRIRSQRWRHNRRILKLIRRVAASHRSKPGCSEGAVVIFNASTRLTGMSLNAAFALLTRLALELEGVPVVQFACHSGMSRCVLGTDRDDPAKVPPCQACIAQSRVLHSGAATTRFTYHEDPDLATSLQNLSLAQLSEFEYPWQKGSSAIPLGSLVLPSLRWVLRRHHLPDEEATRYLQRQYILSAYHIAKEFLILLEQADPRAVVVFNGQFFPEATARWVAQQRGIPVITHEVGLRPFTAFFTPGEATAYPLEIPADFELDEKQNARLDEYLNQRFQGQFSMAGIRFWHEMQSLDEGFLRLAAGFKQIVPVFTNVIFDTSQPHSNVVFPHMFTWLEMVLDLARQHPETLFVLRAHPDESRPGKASRESVQQWVEQNKANSLPNLLFIGSRQPLSSYALIQRSKFVMIYNSTIGLEASIMGAAVLCAGRARFTQLPTVFFPPTQHDYRRQAEDFLTTSTIDIPPEFRRNARRFLYYQLFRSSLPFDEFLEDDGIWHGFVRLRPLPGGKLFPPDKLSAQQSPALDAIIEGLLHGGNFLLADDQP